MNVYLILFSGVLLLGILAQWLAWKIRIPSILVLLAFGFAAGQFYDQRQLVADDALFALVSLAVAAILLEGGMTLRFRELREAGSIVLRLSSLGALVTWVLGTVALRYCASFSWEVSALIGAILVVTGPTVIGPLLRNVRPRKPVSSVLKWEGIVIDPIGATLAVLVFGVLFVHSGSGGGGGFAHAAAEFGKTVAAGFGLGFGAAKGLIFVIRRHWVPDYLQSVVILSVALGLFALSNWIAHESGLLTVTVMGIVLVNQSHTPVRHIIEFKENLRVILISCLFILLAGRIQWQEIAAILPQGIALVAALILVVRPASVFISTAGGALEFREKLFIALMAPRGIVAAAVSAVFALQMTQLGGEAGAEAERIVPIVFFVIFGTGLFYGLSAAPLARWLKIGVPNPQGVIFAGAGSPWIRETAAELQEAGFPVLLVDPSYATTRKARMAGLRVVTANFISDYVIDDVDLADYGRLLAVTADDHVNSLACIQYSHALGRSNVFMLRPADLDASERASSSIELTGRLLFGEGVDGDAIERLVKRGGTVKRTLITEEFSLDDFHELYGPDALILCAIRSGGNLSIMTEESQPPGIGDTVVALIVSRENDAPKA